MKKRIIPAILLLALAATACTQELSESITTVRTFDTFSATIAEEPATRLHMESATALSWDNGDAIGVFSDLHPEPVMFVMGEDGHFHGEAISGTEFVAYSPYGDLVKNGSRLEIKGWFLESFDRYPGRHLPILAKATDNNLSFKQVCGVIHIFVTGSGNWDYILLYGNNNETVSSESFIDYTEEKPVLQYEGTEFYICRHYNGNIEASQGLDIYFPLAPAVFENGFTLEIGGSEGTASKSTSKRVVIERGKMLSYTLNTDELSLDPVNPVNDGSISAEEKEALIAIYNAMDGPNWKNSENWCSDREVDSWFNVSVEDGHVTNIAFYWNDLKGTFPEEIKNLKWLKKLTLQETPGNITNPDIIFQLSSLESLDYGIGDTYSMDFQEYESWMVTLPSAIGNLKNLKSMVVSGIKGPLPVELFDLEELRKLVLNWAWLNGPLPTGFGKLKNLEYLYIQGRWRYDWDHQITGPIPDDLYDCTNLYYLDICDTQLSGEISPRIANLTKLRHLRFSYNEMSGPIPEELTVINPDPQDDPPIDLRGNHFSGKIPAAFNDWAPWKLCWGYIVEGNDLDMSDCMPYVPDFEVNTLNGGSYSTQSVYSDEMTVFYQLATWCSFSPGIIPELKSLYSKYHDKGLEVVSWSYEDAETLRPYVEEYGIPWIVFSNGYAGGTNSLGLQMWPTNNFPAFAVYDSNGQLVFYSIGTTSQLGPLIEEHFGGGSVELYESTDFSADGTAHVLQTATEGNGIDIVLMGDAYSDRLIADETYATVMNRAMEALFAEEPYKSYRSRFNVRYVDVVSKNEVHTGETALSTWYGEGTAVGGDNPKVVGYAEAALTAAGRSVDDALILVMMNRDYYAGTCYMTGIGDGDYGRGHAIAYMPVSSVGDVFGQVLRHEAGGHGFAKLADEYSYTGAISQDEIDNHRSMEPYGWWRNVDFTADPTAVKWAQFITDNRYASENIGVYEGACTYAFGAFRPTQNSIMNDNTGGFNAPSRYAIWYRINKLSNGSEWTGTYEDFVAWDLAHPSAQSPARRSGRRSPERPLPPLAPPVVTFNLR